MRYGVILAFEPARKFEDGLERFRVLKDDPDQPLTHLLFPGGNRGPIASEETPLRLGYVSDSEFGMGGNPGILIIARYVAAAPLDSATNSRYLDIPPSERGD